MPHTLTRVGSLRARYEITAVVGTALLHPLFVDVLHQRAVFIALAFVGWCTYIGTRVRANRNVLKEWGLQTQGLLPSFVATSAFSLAALIVMQVVARRQHTLLFRPQMALLLALYPVWGTVQQLLVQGIFDRAMANVGAPMSREVLVVLSAALLFGAVHLPDMKLAAATCVLGVAFTVIYLRWRNLWPLGLYHGWLGVFFYYWVLGRDPWSEMFGGAG